MWITFSQPLRSRCGTLIAFFGARLYAGIYMVTAADIFQHIGQALGIESLLEGSAPLQLLTGHADAVHACITPDVETAELHFLEHYGYGITCYFRVRDWQAGATLAEAFLRRIGAATSLESCEDCGTPAAARAYLFVYLEERALPETSSINRPPFLNSELEAANFLQP